MALLDELLSNLKGIKEEAKQSIKNSKDVWEAIGNRDWQAAGFANEEEAIKWLEENEYGNMS